MRWSTVIHLLSLLIVPIHTVNILFYINVIGKSHLDFSDSLINSLVERGHSVDLIVARMNDKVKGNGKSKAKRIYSFGFPGESPWNKVPHMNDPFKDAHFAITGFRQYTLVGNELCDIAVADKGLHQFISEKKYDIGMISTFDYCGVGLLVKAGISSITTFNAVPMLPIQSVTIGLPNIASQFVPLFFSYDLSTLSGRFWNLICWGYINMIQIPTLRQEQTEIFHKQFGDMFDLEDALTRVDLAFINSNEIMEKPRPLNHRIQYIGGINLKSPKPLEKSFDAQLNRPGNGTVIFSFGTQVPSKVYPRYAVKNFVNVFKRFPGYTFLWKYEAQNEEEKKLFQSATNVFPTDWLPQTDLLYDKRVVGFITHAGLNSFVESSYAGKPMVAIPLFADQPHNSQNGIARGTTVVLNKAKLSEESIEAALRSILFDDSYTINAKKLSKMLVEKPAQPKSRFVEWMEYAAANPGLHKVFELPGSQMGIFEYYCVDAILLIATSLLTCCYIVYKLVTLVVAKKKLKTMRICMLGKITPTPVSFHFFSAIH